MADGCRIIFKGEDRLRGTLKKAKSGVVVASRTLRLRMAKRFLKELKSGLKNNKLNLFSLTRYTLSRKRAEGNPLPKSPLYGQGENNPRSIYNLIELRENDKTISVGYARNKVHHSGKRIKQLMLTHAQGATLPGGAILRKRNPLSAALKKFNIHKNAKEEIKPVMKEMVKKIVK